MPETERVTVSELQVGDTVVIPHGVEHVITTLSEAEGYTTITYDSNITDRLPNDYQMPRVRRA